MCLLLLLHRVRGDLPIVVAANRDEYFDRPSAPPAFSKDGRVLAPRDLRAGGTWIGVNRDGVFAGITNRSGTPLDAKRPSRGEICGAALGEASARSAAARVIESVSKRPTNAFNLALADAEDAIVIHYDARRRAEPIDLAPGLHVLTNHHDVDRLFVKEIPERFKSLGRAAEHHEEALLAALADVAKDHTVRAPGDHAICKHFDGRGTVSSSLVLVGSPPRPRVRFLYAPGPPCQAVYKSVPGTFVYPRGERG